MFTLRRLLTQARKAVRIPVLVAGLIILPAVMPTLVEIRRLAEEQGSDLRTATGAYLDDLSAAVLAPLVRGDARGVFDAIRPEQGGLHCLFGPRYAILASPDGRIIASSDPRRYPPQSAVPDELREQFAIDDDLVAIDANNGRALLAKTLRTNDVSTGRVFAEVDIGLTLRAYREIRLKVTLVSLGLMLAITLGGYFVWRAGMFRLPPAEECNFIDELIRSP